MDDDALLAAALRRYLTDGDYRYVFIDDGRLTLDGTVSITPDERAALLRACDRDGVTPYSSAAERMNDLVEPERTGDRG